MSSDRKLYKWFYDTIHSRYYNLLVKWCFLPFGGEAKVRREMLDDVPLPPEGRILDMCCGTGNTTFVIAEKTGARSTIKGIDLSSGQIRVAKKRNRCANVEFLVMDASRTSFSEAEFDTVVIPHAIHEMPRATRFAVLAEARRVLASGGILGILEIDNPPNLLLRLFIGLLWFYWLPFNLETPTRRDMMKHGLREEVVEAGFRNVQKSSMHNGVFQVVKGQK